MFRRFGGASKSRVLRVWDHQAIRPSMPVAALDPWSRIWALTADSGKLQYEFRVIEAGFHSLFCFEYQRTVIFQLSGFYCSWHTVRSGYIRTSD